MKENQLEVLKQTELLGRQFTVYGTPDVPLFKAKDVASIIEYNNITNLLSLVDDDEKGVRELLTPGGNQQVWFLTEDGLYEILMQSRKPIAKQFKKGVKQILREVRTTGGYIATKADDTPEEIMARALQIANATLAKREARIQQLEAVNEEQVKQLSEAAPKVSYYDTTLQSVNTLTTTQIAKELGLDAPKLNQRLKAAGVLFRQSGMWMLRQPYSTMGLTATRTQTYTRSDGSTGTSMYTVWTERGRHFIHVLHDCDYNATKARKMIKRETVPAV